MPFLVVAAVVRGGAGCQGSTVGRPRSGVALTASTTTFATIGGEEGHGTSSTGHAVVVVWSGDTGLVEVSVDGFVDGVGDGISAGLDPFEPGQRS